MPKKQLNQRIHNMIKSTVTQLPPDVTNALAKALATETNQQAIVHLTSILRNANFAKTHGLPVCQDTGFPCYHFTGENYQQFNQINQAINEETKNATREGILRPNVVDSVTHKGNGGNIGEGLPFIHTDLQEGECSVTYCPKGGGSENCSVLRMLNPNADWQDEVLNIVRETGGKPCPPYIIGIVVGGMADQAMELSKQLLLREIGSPAVNDQLGQWEKELLEKINATDIGPMGTGGKTTALAVHIAKVDTHPTCLPLAVSFLCSSARRQKINPYNDSLQKPLIEKSLNILESLPEGTLDFPPGPHFNTSDEITGLELGDICYLSGTLITGRDQAHKRIMEFIEQGNELPFTLNNSWMFHAGPIVIPKMGMDINGKNCKIKAIGSTTSTRMAEYNDMLQQQGVKSIIGKAGIGDTGELLYFTYTGGCAAIATSMIEIENVYWLDLGRTEAVWQLKAKNFGPLMLTSKGKKTILR